MADLAAFAAAVEAKQFSYAWARALLLAMRAVAPVRPLRDAVGDREIILRHDIDLDLELARRFAEIEIECDVRASYFINLGSISFNPGAERNRKVLAFLGEHGFEVGLHFDPTLYPGRSDRELNNLARREADYLSVISGQKITSVSLHRPSVHGQYPPVKGMRNAYDVEWFDADRYMSDSCMDFRGKDPFTFIEKASSGSIQILLHPMHFSDAGYDFPEITVEYFRIFMDSMKDSDLQSNRRALRVMPGGVESIVGINRKIG